MYLAFIIFSINCRFLFITRADSVIIKIFRLVIKYSRQRMETQIYAKGRSTIYIFSE